MIKGDSRGEEPVGEGIEKMVRGMGYALGGIRDPVATLKKEKET